MLENRFEVEERLRDLSFGLALCGHEHDQDVGEPDGGLMQCIAGTASQSRRGNSFVVLEIEASAAADDRVPVTVVRYMCETNANAFVAQAPCERKEVAMARW